MVPLKLSHLVFQTLGYFSLSYPTLSYIHQSRSGETQDSKKKGEEQRCEIKRRTRRENWNVQERKRGSKGPTFFRLQFCRLWSPMKKPERTMCTNDAHNM